jgi:hypothetical protein
LAKSVEPPPPDWEAWTREALAGLLAEGTPPGEARVEARRMCERMKIRHAWFRERFNAFLEMQERAGEAVLDYMDARPEIDWDDEDAPEVPEPPEQAIAQAIYAEVMAAVKEDRWPRHLHFRDV